MAKVNNVVKLDLKTPVPETVRSCVKLFGEENAKEVLHKIYRKGSKNLQQALAELQKIENEITAADIGSETYDLNDDLSQVENDEQGDQLMQAIKLDKEVNSIDNYKDTRVANSDHGIDNTENTLEWWLKHAKRSEKDAVDFRDYLNAYDTGIYLGTIHRVIDYNDRFGTPKVAIQVKLAPMYSTSSHRGYVTTPCPLFYTIKQFKSICAENGWDMDDDDALIGQQVNICIRKKEDTGTNEYFLQSKQK